MMLVHKSLEFSIFQTASKKIFILSLTKMSALYTGQLATTNGVTLETDEYVCKLFLKVHLMVIVEDFRMRPMR